MPLLGHLNPFSTLAHELIRRGHQVTFLFMCPTLPNWFAVAGSISRLSASSDYPRRNFRPERYPGNEAGSTGCRRVGPV